MGWLMLLNSNLPKQAHHLPTPALRDKFFWHLPSPDKTEDPAKEECREKYRTHYQGALTRKSVGKLGHITLHHIIRWEAKEQSLPGAEYECKVLYPFAGLFHFTLFLGMKNFHWKDSFLFFHHRAVAAINWKDRLWNSSCTWRSGDAALRLLLYYSTILNEYTKMCVCMNFWIEGYIIKASSSGAPFQREL